MAYVPTERKLEVFETTSIYKRDGVRVKLPFPLNQMVCTAIEGFHSMRDEVIALGGQLYLSDCFRTYDMQYQAHLDYTTGKKKAFSPPPGRSFHEAGRAIDIDVENLGISLSRFWDIASKHGWVPIIAKPSTSYSECWHFDFREFWEIILQKYGYSKAANLAIMDIGVNVDEVLLSQGHLAVQGRYDMALDGIHGKMTEAAMRKFKYDVGLPIDSEYTEEYMIKLKLSTDEYWIANG